MPRENESSDSPTKSSPVARFRAGQFAVWLPVCLVHGLSVAWVAVVIEAYRAPLILFPLLIGIGLGVTGVGLVRVCQVGNRTTILLGVVLAVAITIVGQHYLHYRSTCREIERQALDYRMAKQAFEDEVLGESPIPPENFGRFLQWRAARGLDILGHRVIGTPVWLTWSADGLLLLAAALGVVIPAIRQPYCDRCRSWYRTTRKGPLAPTMAEKLAGLIEIELPEEVASARYRLVTCNGGCGPSGFELSWTAGTAKSSSAKVWLDADRRNQVLEPLDQRQPDERRDES